MQDTLNHQATALLKRQVQMRLEVSRGITSLLPSLVSCALMLRPRPPYSEAMRQTPQAIPDRDNVLLLNDVMKQMREDALQIERLANHKGCCEQLMDNGCLGDLLQACCVSACISIPQFLIQKYRLIYLDKIEYLVIKGAGRKGQSTTTAPESSPARLY